MAQLVGGWITPPQCEWTGVRAVAERDDHRAEAKTKRTEAEWAQNIFWVITGSADLDTCYKEFTL
jgi:hypothetical protein